MYRSKSILVGLCVLFFVSGCGTGRARISGKVTLDGRVVPSGLVTFRPAKATENSVTVELSEQGQYEVELPVGEVQVCVDNREWETRTIPPAEAPPNAPPEIQARFANAKARVVQTRQGPYVAIPSKCYTIESSGIKFTVSAKEPVHDILLTK